MAQGSQEHAISKLNDLVEIMKDAEAGYQTAAEGTKDNQIKTFFEDLASMKHRQASELQTAVRDLGGQPEQSGTTRGAAYRMLTSVRSALSSDDALSMLEQCERGEDVQKSNFESALNDQDLPMQCRTLIERQYQEVLRSHDSVKAMRNARRH